VSLTACKTCSAPNESTARYCARCGSGISPSHAGIWALGIVCLLIFGLCSFAAVIQYRGRQLLQTPDVKAPATPSTAHPQNAERAHSGSQLFEALPPKARAIQLSGFGEPSIRLVIRESEWNRFSRERQIDMSHYAESLINEVRAQPETYIDMPRSAPLYSSAVEYARKICDSCWEIVAGQPTKTDGLSIDHIVVQGDEPWEAADACCRGFKGSAFRASARP
jgi:hypothetical protein